MSSNSANNKRIAKNTLLLYLRMFLLMGITLYTSRVVLNTLGVEDYGVYNVVGGFVAMFGILTVSLSGSISRYITVELGKGDLKRLRKIFSTSVNVQLFMSLIVVIVGEVIGVWFMNTHMQIPLGRESAAQWVLHCSILSFCVSIITVPYNATIIAHERMSAFAYISILEAASKLFIVYLLTHSSIDRLILYAFLLLLIQVLLRAIYWIFCRVHFEECRGKADFDMKLFREMLSFAGWNFIGNGAHLLNTQGVNMIINVFFGVSFNAARGIANQVNGAVQQFVSNFMTALNPQITKSYATGDVETAFILACRGAKFSYFLMLIIALPLIWEVDYILRLWLVIPPEYSSTFVIWTLLSSMTTVIGMPLVTLVMANGDIKSYQLNITIFSILPFPLTFIAYKMGTSVLAAYIIYFIVYYLIIYVRLILVHNKTGLPYQLYLKDVVLRTHVVTVLSSVAPAIIVFLFQSTFSRFLVNIVVSILFTTLLIYIIGLDKHEKIKIISSIKFIINSKFKV